MKTHIRPTAGKPAWAQKLWQGGVKVPRRLWEQEERTHLIELMFDLGWLYRESTPKGKMVRFERREPVKGTWLYVKSTFGGRYRTDSWDGKRVYHIPVSYGTGWVAMYSPVQCVPMFDNPVSMALWWEYVGIPQIHLGINLIDGYQARGH